MSKKRKPFFERISGRKYYGRWGAGSVILRNGAVMFHGNQHEVTALLKKLKADYK